MRSRNNYCTSAACRSKGESFSHLYYDNWNISEWGEGYLSIAGAAVAGVVEKAVAEVRVASAIGC